MFRLESIACGRMKMADGEFRHTYTYDDLSEEHRKTLEEGVQLCGAAMKALYDLQHFVARNTTISGEYDTDRDGLQVGREAVTHIKNAIMARGLEPLMAVTTRVVK